MAADQLERVFEVLDMVSKEIADKFGSSASEHLDLDRLFARAEHDFQNGLSVEETKENLVSYILPVSGKSYKKKNRELNDKVAGREEPRDKDIVQNPLGIGSSTKFLEPEEHKVVSTLEIDMSANAKDQNVLVGDSLPMDILTLPETVNQLDVIGAAGTLESGKENPSIDDDTNDITILTPPHRSPAPLIDIADEKTDENSCSSSSNSVCSVAKDLQCDSETYSKGSVCTQLFQIHKTNEEKSVESIEEFLSENVVNDVKEASYTSKSELEDRDPEVSSSTSEAFNAKNYSIKKSNFKEYPANGDADYVDGFLKGDDPVDELWVDAQYVCSLLPYFTLADVHQSMADNFYHPNRRIHVLEAYVDIAFERGEYVPDNVLLALTSAKKRPYREGNEGPLWRGKKMKTDSGGEKSDWNNGVKNSTFQYTEVGEPFPSTSSGLVPHSPFPSSLDKKKVTAPQSTVTENEHPKDLSSKSHKADADESYPIASDIEKC